MKHFTTLLFVIWMLGLHSICSGQIQPMGFTQKVVSPASIFHYSYRPKLKLMNDTLYVSTNTGVYRKDLKQNSSWEQYAFKGIPVTEFVKNGSNLLAISPGTKDGKDSLMFLSEDNGKTFQNYTSPHFFEFEEYNYPHRIVQNPRNPNSILLFHTHYGLSGSEDFGKSWKNLNAVGGGYQSWFAGFHPLDTTTIFYSGEMDSFTGYIFRSTDSGITWPDFFNYYKHPGGDNCIHDIAFHPTNPEILAYSGEMTIAKSTDKGETWNIKDLFNSSIYFYTILFDGENPDYLYASGLSRKSLNINDTIFVYRSTDMGDSWHIAYKEKLDMNGGGVIDMLKYKDKLIFYTQNAGLFELDVKKTQPLSINTIEKVNNLRVYPNPATNTLFFDTETRIQHIDILNPMGQTIHQYAVSDNEKRIDVTFLIPGNYFVIFHTDQQTKIIKKVCISKK